ncbi:hypothetical protein D0T84_07850 [Dysgonomonas sp. 521]|uniref:fimbrial protein n=1 Tax=Dysgonomonas sp. 521 TaxID=2302932 RepID=UPI0013D3CE4C|nr:fimbrial protein [Dysgonomonas sp. 521]NDV94831.1 hypothetical protein [Dysgonomonas sp. 521]
MKVIKLLFIVLVSLSFFACNNDDEVAGGGKEGQKTKVEISISTGAKTKTVGSAVELEESTINTVTVLAFDADGNLEDAAHDAALNDEDKILLDDIKVGGEKTFLVVANSPANTFAGITSKSVAMAKMMTLAATQTSSTLIMTGSNSKTLVQATNENPNEITVTVKRLAARIDLNPVTVSLDPITLPDATLDIQRIYIRNVATKYSFNPISTVASRGLVNTALIPGEATTWIDTYNGDGHYFYVGPNPVTGDITENANWNDATRLVIEAEFTEGDEEPKTVYYPIAINRIITDMSNVTGEVDAAEKGTGVHSNTVYKLDVTITEKGSDDGGDIFPAPCLVQVQVAEWKYVNQVVEF